MPTCGIPPYANSYYVINAIILRNRELKTILQNNYINLSYALESLKTILQNNSINLFIN